MSELLKCGFSRNSFDRFGDDLCEYILQYLTFEDKIKYEDACKQWMRTIYNRQNNLQIVDNLNYQNNNNALLAYKVLSYENNNMKPLENLLMKCKGINHIKVGYNEHQYIWLQNRKILTNNMLFRIIADNCQKLLSIDCNDINLRVHYDEWQYFVSKRGKTLKSIIFPRNAFYSIMDETKNRIIFYCQSITRIENIKLSQLIDTNSTDILAPKLSEIKINSESLSQKLDETNNLMNIFVDRYRVTIKVLDIYSSFNCIQLVECLSKLINLEKLTLDINGLYLSTDTKPYLYYSQIMKYISNCTKLKYLHLSVTGISVDLNSKDVLSVKLFKNCKELKYLNIESDLIDDSFVCNIEVYLPNLKQIQIKTPFSFTDVTLNYLSKANQLSTIDFKPPIIRELMFTDTGVANILENCVRIKSLTFQWCNQLTTATIDKLVKIAEQRPKISFNIKFVNYTKFNKPLQDHIKHPLPPNLEIKFY